MARRLTHILLLVVLTVSASAQESGFSKEHPLLFGIDSDYAPLQYIDENGKAQGYDIEFTRELLTRLNIPYKYRPNTWEKISDDILSGRVDLGMMVYSPYRANITNYSRAVFRLYYQIVHRKTENDHFDVRNLAGKNIAYMSSRPVTDTLTKVNAVLSVVTNLGEAMVDLSNGRYDAVICFRYQTKYLIENNNLKNLVTEDLTLAPREYCYVSNNRHLIGLINSELEKMEGEHLIKSIYGDDITSTFGGLEIPSWVWYAMGLIIIVSLLIINYLQRQHQQRLQREVERAQRSEQMKTVFLGNVSHALRTPLNAIIGFSDVLRADCEADSIPLADRQQLLDLINSNGQQLLYFINELLQLSNFEGNEMLFNHVETDIQATVSSLFDEVRPLLAPAVTLSDLSPNKRFTAVVDPNIFRLVTLHLLTNAVKHTSEGSVSVVYEEHDGGMRLSVTDTGEGLPESLRENIFSLLSEKATFVQEKSPGLGLTICKAVIDRCNGRIGASDVQSGGTTFWYWVPCKVITGK